MPKQLKTRLDAIERTHGIALNRIAFEGLDAFCGYVEKHGPPGFPFKITAGGAFRAIEATNRPLPRSHSLNEPEGRYSTSELPTVETDTQGRVTSINEAFTEMCGYTLRELRGKKPGDVLQGKDTEQDVVAQFRAAIKAIRPFQGTLTNYDSRGHAYRVKIKMHPLFDRAGNLVGFRAIEQKLPARKTSPHGNLPLARH